MIVKIVFLFVFFEFSNANGSGFLLPYPLESAPYYCTVIDDKLFINGLFDKNLNETELEEFQDYWTKLLEFKEKYQNAFNLLNPVDAMMLAPTKPSFCRLPKKPFTFIGCTIQNDRIYVNHLPIRDLTPQDIEHLESFEKQVDLYEIAMQNAKNQGGGFQPTPPTPPKICPTFY